MNNPAITITNFFKAFLEGFDMVWQFINTPIVFKDYGFAIGATQEEQAQALANGNLTPLGLLSISLGAFLVVCLALHIWHLVKPVF